MLDRKSRNNGGLGFAILATAQMATITSASAFPSSQAKRYEKPPFEVGNEIGLAYSKTREYKREFDAAIEGAYQAAKQYMRDSSGKEVTPAIVADIDETLLDNREHFRRHKEFNWPQFENWIRSARAPLLDRTAQFLAWSRKKGFAVFLVTGRHEGLRAPTIANLIYNRVSYDGLLMRPQDDKRGAEPVKSALRDSIEKMGFQIVVNIGDQYSDLVGGHAIDCEKLPNRIYFVE